MTDKQKEAIELLKKLRFSSDEYYIVDGAYAKDIDYLLIENAIETVLNLLKKKDKEIYCLEKEKQDAWEEWNNLEQSSYETEKKLRVEIKMKDKQIEQYQNMLATNDMLHVLECDKKDKMIDLMSEELTTPIHSKEWVKDYYERKVETENK